MRKYKITISFEIENTGSLELDKKEIEERMIIKTANAFGYGANQFWYLPTDTITVKCKKRWLFGLL